MSDSYMEIQLLMTLLQAGRADSVGDNVSAFVSGLRDEKTYHFIAQINNSLGIANGSDKTFTTATPGWGWVTATGYSDPDNRWNEEEKIFDDELSTETDSWHASNALNGTWSSYLYLTRSPAIISDKVRFYVKSTNTNRIAIDIYKNNNWETIYAGGFTGLQWTEKNFTIGYVSNARFALGTSDNGAGFNWEAYEFDFYKTGIIYPELSKKEIQLT